ncbi:hypothetical protein CJF42_13835 [Pseudoalteromonas sp. NBT06-2]|uniref:hypothetical protein n=1 Tax=Pseudoalteromonas sp. NBT06-2 TaxID=2025950 RepID=UPI000BA5637C|nr:hypothetical protein [Pseudoalteromonas sp. NBT06-2]PAJ73807.1 hypothetical protein CJF42_13835 [Pseudoalteromonas sp. NBT06-2]
MQQTLDLESYSTEIGAAFLGERAVYRGKDLHHELGDKTWFELLIFGIKARKYSLKEVKILNYIWLSTSYPDPRIWPNQVMALAGSVRASICLANSAAMALTEATIYGQTAFTKGFDLFKRVNIRLKQGKLLDEILKQEIKENNILYGYGRPISATDERVPHFMKKVSDLGFKSGKYYKIAFDIGDYLKRNKGLEMNISALYNAICADLGFTLLEYQAFMIHCFNAGMLPCYLEARDNAEGDFFNLPVSAVKYLGNHLPRSWPKV